LAGIRIKIVTGSLGRVLNLPDTTDKQPLTTDNSMKSAYELAMERLNKKSPTVKPTNQQKQALAEIDSKYAAKIAQRELLVKDELRKAAEKGDYEAMQQLERQLVSDRKSLRAEMEEKKEKIRQGAKIGSR
jgi:hypothetical protein